LLCGSSVRADPLRGSRRTWGGGDSGWTSLSMGGPTGEYSRGLIYWALQRLWRQAPFSTGALLSIMGDPFTGNSER